VFGWTQKRRKICFVYHETGFARQAFCAPKCSKTHVRSSTISNNLWGGVGPPLLRALLPDPGKGRSKRDGGDRRGDRREERSGEGRGGSGDPLVSGR